MFTEEDFDIQTNHKEYASLPQRIMMKSRNDCGRDVFKFWDTIEWDSTWLRHDTEEEKKLKEIAREFNSHPFNKWMEQPKQLTE